MSIHSDLSYYFIAVYFVAFSNIYAQLIPINTMQIYIFKNNIDIEEIQQNLFTEYETEFQLEISSKWNSLNKEDQLLHFQLNAKENIKTKISKRKRNNSKYEILNAPELSNLKYRQFYIYLKNGEIKDFLANKEDKDNFSLNFKRSIASLFNFRPIYKENVQEVDVNGKCNISYSLKNATHISKNKDFCQNWDLKVNQRNEVPLTLNKVSYGVLNYALTLDQMLIKLSSIESHEIRLNYKNDAGLKIKSNINLSHVSSDICKQIHSNSIDNIIYGLTDFSSYNIKGEILEKISETHFSLETQLKRYENEMGTLEIGKLLTANIFTKLLPESRLTKKTDFKKILKTYAVKENLDQIVDLIGATQTKDAHSAFIEIFQLENEDDFEIIERYLQALSISTRPTKEIFTDLYDKLIKKNLFDMNVKLYDTLLQTLASISYAYALKSSYIFEDEIALKMKNYIIGNLDRCEDSTCKIIYIRGLENLKNPSTISTLLKLTKEHDRFVSVTAMKALRNFDVKLFSNKDRSIFETIFYQISSKYDSSVRILALEIIIKMGLTKFDLFNLFRFLTSQNDSFEIKKYLLERINLLKLKCHSFRNNLKEILKNNTQFNNYNTFGQHGMSSVLERELFVSSAFSETLLSTQEVFKGILKQGNVDYIIKAQRNEMSKFNIGLFTSGLSNFISNNDDENEDENEEITAGIEVKVQNVNFRPLILFNSQSELMGHYMSGTASNPTTVYKATLILQDHEEYIILQNGATLFLQFVGAHSINLNGKIEFSLWNRNALTEINKNSGQSIYGLIEYRTFFVQIKNQFSIDSEPKVGVNTNIDFYSGIKLCVKLEKSSSILRYQNENRLKIMGSNDVISENYTVNWKLPGNTLALNQNNNNMCNLIG